MGLLEPRLVIASKYDPVRWASCTSGALSHICAFRTTLQEHELLEHVHLMVQVSILAEIVCVVLVHKRPDSGH